jgi:hypothetical protein
MSGYLTRIRDRKMIQYVRNGVLYATEDHWVFRSKNWGETWETLCRLPPKTTGHLAARIKDSILRYPLTRYFRRNIGIHNLVVLSSGTVIIHYDGIYRYDGNGVFSEKVFRFSDDSIIGPLKNGMAVDYENDDIYFGEYPIERPNAVRLFRGYNDGRKWESCYRFPLGAIRHVHSVVQDRFRHRLWVCTGDNDDEAALYFTDNRFKTVHKFGGGDQSWRMVSLIPTEAALFWGSDAGQDAPADRENFIYKYDFRTNQKVPVQPIDKPAYFSTVLIDGTMVIATHFEPLMKRKAVQSADIWISRDKGDNWEMVQQFPFQPARRSSGTRYASICVPRGDNSAKDLFFTPLNVEHNDFSLLKWRLP